MQLVFEWPILPAFDEPLDSSIIILIPWLETKRIMKDEVLIDRRLEPLLNLCFPAVEIRTRLGERGEASLSTSLTDSLEVYRFVDPKSGIDQTRFPDTALRRSCVHG